MQRRRAFLGEERAAARSVQRRGCRGRSDERSDEGLGFGLGIGLGLERSDEGFLGPALW